MQALSALQQAAFSLFGVPVTWTELIGDATGLWCVWLVARGSTWNWPIGLLNNLFFAVLFAGARLYGDASLQGVFFALGVWGWWRWARGGDRGKVLPVRRTRRTEWVVLGSLGVVAQAAGTAWLLLRTDAAAPFFDTATVVLSLAATYGQAQRLVESWWLWIAVDVISVPLYASRALYPTALVYAVFLALCIVGLRGWRRELRGSAS